MAAFDPGPLAEISAHRGDAVWTLVFVRQLRHPVEKVWAALTEADQLDRWAPFRPDLSLDRTGPRVLTMVDGTTIVESAGQVLRVERPRLLEYTWGEDLLRWELEPTGTGTTLRLSHRHAERDWLPKLAAGWHLSLVVADRLLEGNPIEPIRGPAAMNYGWQELHDAYASALENPADAG